MTPDNPTLCIAGSGDLAPEDKGLPGLLREVALERGWLSRYVDVCGDDEIDEVTALVLILDAGVDSVRRRFPHALLISPTTASGVDLRIPDTVDRHSI